jgi:hypothetical protein
MWSGRRRAANSPVKASRGAGVGGSLPAVTGGDEFVAGQRLVDRPDKIAGKAGLNDIGICTCGKACFHIALSREDGVEYDSCPATSILQFGNGFHSIHDRHGDIHDDEIGIKSRCGFQKRLSVRYRAYHLEPRREYLLDLVDDRLIVVRQKYAWVCRMYPLIASGACAGLGGRVPYSWIMSRAAALLSPPIRWW